METSITALLFHFFNLLLGISALFVISRRVSFIPHKIQSAFLLQALFYNIGSVFNAIMDFMFYIFWNTIRDNIYLRSTHRLISILYLVVFAFWAIFFTKMVFSLLGKHFEYKENKIYKIGLLAFGLLFSFILVYRLSGIKPNIYMPIYLMVHLGVFFVVINYSLFLLRNIKIIYHKEKKTALIVYSVLMIIYSLFLLIVLLGNISDFWFIFKTGVFSSILLDIVFNLFTIFWALMYMNSFNSKEEPIAIHKEPLEKIAEKYQISNRELEIIQLVCEGKSNQEIADLLFVSLGTVKSHLYNIYNKIGIKNRIQLTKLF